MPITSSSTPRLWLSLVFFIALSTTTFGEPINVLDHGADPTGATFSRDAIQTALNIARTTQQKVYIPAGTYVIEQHINAYTEIIGDGMGRTILVFDNRFDVFSGNAKGMTFGSDGKKHVQVGISDATILIKGNNGGVCLNTASQMSEYFHQQIKYVFKNLSFYDWQSHKFGFNNYTTHAWSKYIALRSCQGVSMENIYIRGNYRPEQSEQSQFDSTGIYMDARNPTGNSTAVLNPRLRGLYITSCKYGIELGARTFAFIQDVDIARSWVGIHNTNAAAIVPELIYSEIFIDNAAINAQKYGVHFQEITRVNFSNSFVNRHKDGDNNPYTGNWIGYYLQHVNKSMFTNLTAQARENTAVLNSKGMVLEECANVAIANFVAGHFLDTAVELQDCHGLMLSTSLQNYNVTNPKGVVFMGSTQHSNVRISKLGSFNGLEYSFLDNTAERNNTVTSTTKNTVMPGLTITDIKERSSHPSFYRMVYIDKSTGELYTKD
ncbi:glycosyl hydrolase family 28-related protein [Poriferisphaera sp. WC338]|uniref:glycosyl hydrolase family 28-related protein n=1 Tax=Poriferisphaera sp. WC338 TaxID=3425129 RepID=UPI003D815396